MIGGPAVAGTFSIGLYAAVAAPLRVRTALDGVHTQPCRADAADGPDQPEPISQGREQ
jgi:hypothetical protein